MLVPRVLAQVLLEVPAPRAVRVPRIQYLPAQRNHMLSRSSNSNRLHVEPPNRRDLFMSSWPATEQTGHEAGKVQNQLKSIKHPAVTPGQHTGEHRDDSVTRYVHWELPRMDPTPRNRVSPDRDY